ncbi:HAMP domain-containing sensor histidine kinase [Cohnella soli]|uniref:histidine kinase n=1 Tax=Cohnella soli TaxID=425005 RepID=A0ABW0HX43_9BACL
MKSNPWEIATGRKSIRMQMIWTFIASLAVGMLVSTSIPTGLLFDVPISVIAFFGSFTVTFLWLTRNTIRYLRELSEGLSVISAGNLRYRIPETRKDELGQVAFNVNTMAEKLENLIERERSVEKSKMELITGVSHDLRTPLTSIIGYLDLLKGKAYQDEAEYDRFVGNTYVKAQQLRTLIDELFEYTRITQGGLRLELEEIDLRELLVQLFAEIEPLASELQIEMRTSLPPGRIMVAVDPERIRRAIDNLIANALKFSIKPGTIRIALETDGNRAAIAIENEGKAITKEQEERLFERFYKVDDARTQDSLEAGAGLGLSIARGIVELHGGQLSFVHDNGRFTFRIGMPVVLIGGATTK